MADTIQDKNIEYDEIDLIQLLANFLKLLMKHVWVIITCTILGGALGFFIINSLLSYKTQAIAQSRVLNISEVKGILSNFNELLEVENYDLLEKRTKLNVKDLKHIKELDIQSSREFEQGFANKVDKDSVFVVIATVKDLKVLPQLAEAIANYINSNTFVQEKNKIYEDNHRRLLKQIRENIEHANLMKEEVMRVIKKDVETSIGSIYEQTTSLLEKELVVRDRLNQKDDIQFISEFITYKKSVMSNPAITAILSVTLGFGAAVLLVLVLELVKVLRIKMSNV